MSQVNTDDLDEIVPLTPKSPTPTTSPVVDPTHHFFAIERAPIADNMVASPPENPQILTMYSSSSDSIVEDIPASLPPRGEPGPVQSSASPPPASTEITVNIGITTDVTTETVNSFFFAQNAVGLPLLPTNYAQT